MCQLIYCNLKDPFLNSLAVYFLSTIGSKIHDDGCGIICSDNSIWKTKFAAEKVLNLGEILYKKIEDGNPVPFHIRQATWGIEVKDENAHPFDGKHYILMHNGTLIKKDEDEPKDKKKDSDSLNFLKELDKVTDKKGADSFESIFNTAMTQFMGKFAFIIRSKDSGADYIIRGKTAELWISFLSINDKEVGYVIDTSEFTLKDSFKFITNIASLNTGNKYTFSEPTKLDAETIYVARKDDIHIIGKTVEYAAPVKPVVNSIIPVTNKPNGYNRITKKESNADTQEIIKLGTKIFDFLDGHSLTLLDLQIMVQVIGGISLLEVTKDDLQFITDFMIPKISCSKNLRKTVKGFLNGEPFPVHLYRKNELDYPWTINKPERITQVLSEYKKELLTD